MVLWCVCVDVDLYYVLGVCVEWVIECEMGVYVSVVSVVSVVKDVSEDVYESLVYVV